MGNFYLRVPHYVGAFFRNKDDMHPIAEGGEVRFDNSSMVTPFLNDNLFYNQDENIIPGCFCARHWRHMLRGMYINPSIQHETEIPPKPMGWLVLTEHEIETLSGMPVSGKDEYNEYLCIRIPDEVAQGRRVFRTNGQWQLNESGARRLCSILTNEYWNAFFTFIRTDRKAAGNGTHPRGVMESIERFMARFGIRCSDDGKEKNTLKRNYYRKRMRMVLGDMDADRL